MADEQVQPGAIVPKGIDKLAAALAKAQAKFKNPEKNRTVKVKMTAGGTYEYSYATLDAVLDCVRGPLAENGLAFMQLVTTQDGMPVLVTKLVHSSGQEVEAVYNLPGGLSAQAFGAAITYARRYTACPMLGICGETDSDAEEARAEELTVDEEKKRQAAEKLKDMVKSGKAKMVPPIAPPPAKPELKPMPMDITTPLNINKEKPEEHDAAEPKEDNLNMDFPPADELTINMGLMSALNKAGITVAQFKAWGVAKGNFPDTMDMSKLNESFLTAVLKPANWAKVVSAIKGAK